MSFPITESKTIKVCEFKRKKNHLEAIDYLKQTDDAKKKVESAVRRKDEDNVNFATLPKILYIIYISIREIYSRKINIIF